MKEVSGMQAKEGEELMQGLLFLAVRIPTVPVEEMCAMKNCISCDHKEICVCNQGDLIV